MCGPVAVLRGWMDWIELVGFSSGSLLTRKTLMVIVYVEGLGAFEVGLTARHFGGRLFLSQAGLYQMGLLKKYTEGGCLPRFG